MSLNTDLKARRRELGLSQYEVAKLVGVSESTISRWESGNIANMKRSYIDAYARALHLSPADIIGVPDEEKESQPEDLVNGDPELTEILTRARDDPHIRMLFSVTKDAKPEDIEMAIQIIQRFKGE